MDLPISLADSEEREEWIAQPVNTRELVPIAGRRRRTRFGRLPHEEDRTENVESEDDPSRKADTDPGSVGQTLSEEDVNPKDLEPLPPSIVKDPSASAFARRLQAKDIMASERKPFNERFGIRDILRRFPALTQTEYKSERMRHRKALSRAGYVDDKAFEPIPPELIHLSPEQQEELAEWEAIPPLNQNVQRVVNRLLTSNRHSDAEENPLRAQQEVYGQLQDFDNARSQLQQRMFPHGPEALLEGEVDVARIHPARYLPNLSVLEAIHNANHPGEIMPDGTKVRHKVRTMKTGRHCFGWCKSCDPCKEGNLFSDFAAYGPGLAAYFKFLKAVSWMLFFMFLFSLPLLYFASQGGEFENDFTTGGIFSAATLGSFGDVRSPIANLRSNHLNMPGDNLIKWTWALLDFLICLVLLVTLWCIRKGEKVDQDDSTEHHIAADLYTFILTGFPEYATITDIKTYLRKYILQGSEEIVSVQLGGDYSDYLRLCSQRQKLLRRIDKIECKLMELYTHNGNHTSTEGEVARYRERLLKERTALLEQQEREEEEAQRHSSVATRASATALADAEDVGPGNGDHADAVASSSQTGGYSPLKLVIHRSPRLPPRQGSPVHRQRLLTVQPHSHMDAAHFPIDKHPVSGAGHLAIDMENPESAGPEAKHAEIVEGKEPENTSNNKGADPGVSAANAAHRGSGKTMEEELEQLDGEEDDNVVRESKRDDANPLEESFEQFSTFLTVSTRLNPKVNFPDDGDGDEESKNQVEEEDLVHPGLDLVQRANSNAAPRSRPQSAVRSRSRPASALSARSLNAQYTNTVAPVPRAPTAIQVRPKSARSVGSRPNSARPGTASATSRPVSGRPLSAVIGAITGDKALTQERTPVPVLASPSNTLPGQSTDLLTSPEGFSKMFDSPRWSKEPEAPETNLVPMEPVPEGQGLYVHPVRKKRDPNLYLPPNPDLEELPPIVPKNRMKNPDKVMSTRVRLPLEISDKIADAMAKDGPVSPLLSPSSGGNSKPAHLIAEYSNQLNEKIRKKAQKLWIERKKLLLKGQEHYLDIEQLTEDIVPLFAFVTVNSQADARNIYRRLNQSLTEKILCCSKRIPKWKRFNGVYPIDAKPAPKPSVIMWENMGYGFFSKLFFQILSLFCILSLLFISLLIFLLFNKFIRKVNVNPIAESAFLPILIILLQISASQVIQYLVMKVEKHTSTETARSSIFFKLVTFQYLTSCAIFLLTNINYDYIHTGEFSAAPVPPTTKEEEVELFTQGSFIDVTSTWYYVVITPIVLIQVLNIFTPHLPTFLHAITMWCRNRSWRKQGEKVSSQWPRINNVIGPQMNIPMKLAHVVASLGVVLTFSTGAPGLYLVGFFVFFVTFWVELFAFSRLYSQPTWLGIELLQSASRFLYVWLFLHALIGLWMLTGPAFPLNSSILLSETWSYDFASNPKSIPTLIHRAVKDFTVPMIFVLAIAVLGFFKDNLQRIKNAIVGLAGHNTKGPWPTVIDEDPLAGPEKEPRRVPREDARELKLLRAKKKSERAAPPPGVSRTVLSITEIENNTVVSILRHNFRDALRSGFLRDIPSYSIYHNPRYADAFGNIPPHTYTMVRPIPPPLIDVQKYHGLPKQTPNTAKDVLRVLSVQNQAEFEARQIAYAIDSEEGQYWDNKEAPSVPTNPKFGHGRVGTVFKRVDPDKIEVH